MAKEHPSREAKKKPQKSLKEKRAEKKEKGHEVVVDKTTK